MPPGGLNIRLNDTILGQEARLYDYKRDAMLAFVRANKLNRYITTGGRDAKIGIITVGKSYLDVRQALDELSIDEAMCNDLGVRLFKVACPWPLSQRELKEFAQGLDLIIVVEEKRSLLEVQVREELYGTANQPICIGKKDEQGNWLFPVKGALDPNDIAICIGERILARRHNEQIAAEVARLKKAQRALAEIQDVAQRTPYFCSGCPHNSSTVVPDGMRAYAGIGCHYMVQWMDRSTSGFTQMGARGRQLDRRGAVLQARPCVPEPRRRHLQPLGLSRDPRRDRVGRQHHLQDPVQRRGRDDRRPAQRRRAHGAAGRAPGRGRGRQARRGGDRRAAEIRLGESWPRASPSITATSSIAVQVELAAIPGCTVLIYDQTCAAEKRRRRKRGTFPDPDKRVIINELVCEGCGDCGVVSNCVSVQPLETEFGRKRIIDQTSCNKDFSCVKGFCPSFVTVHGAKLPTRRALANADGAGAARADAAARSTAPTTSSSPASAAPASSPSAACSAWRRISRARASASSTWRASPRRAAPSTATCASPTIPTTSTPSGWPPPRPSWSSAATSWSPAPRRCSPPSSPARPTWW